MSTPVIVVENLSKLYRLGEVGTGSLAHDANRWWHRLRGKEDPYTQVGHVNDRTKKAESDWVYALKNINFEVLQGEILGIIGHNGAGKSTLLKILSRVTAPTTGNVKVKGRIASLLEVGTGFHPELSGRDNIYLNGAILGMTRAEIRSKFDEIVAFAEIEMFIDTPVKRYSSGMYVRLAFAVAAHLEPEILIVDEVLAVGDAEFQKKCLGKMKDVSGHGRTVLFVSHNMTAVSSLCERAILLKAGRVIKVGSVLEGIDEYLSSIAKSGDQKWEGPAGDDNVQVLCARVNGGEFRAFTTDKPIIVELEIQVQRPVYGLIVGWEVWSQREQMLAYSLMDDSKSPPISTMQPGYYKLQMKIPADTFASGCYNLCLDIGIHNIRRIIPEKNVCLELNIENSAGIGRRYLTNSWTNIFRPAWEWKGYQD